MQKLTRQHDHSPPHFHATYGNYEAMFSIATGKLLEGKFPEKQKVLVTAWAIMHKDALIENWKIGIAGGKLKKIKGLH